MPSSKQRPQPRTAARLPSRFQEWFAARGWSPRDHQLEIFARAEAGETTLLIAPTGGGKTLAGFLPSLADLTRGVPGKGIHTLYISPLKALAVDIARNLQAPVSEMGLKVRLETRTGDTPPGRRQRQRVNPPDILLTTPEQIALLIADPHAERYFERLTYIVLDELHALAASKRGDLLALGLARLQKLSPRVRRIGLSATVADPENLARFLASGMACDRAGIVQTTGAAAPDIRILSAAKRLPWAGHLARHAVGDIYEALKVNRLSLIFVNTRAQAELLFQELWAVNDDNLAIALHHGSLAVEQRRKVEAAMTAGSLRAVVSTSTLDLGIDWGDVDLV
ncbi:MAG: DEAD/DEAH box helicase, partial [Hyphomicrobiales bacterium]